MLFLLLIYAWLYSENSIIKLETLTATMWPPKKETDFAMTTTGSASKAIAGGEFKMATKFSGIDVDTKTGPLCEFGDVACPIKVRTIFSPYYSHRGSFT